MRVTSKGQVTIPVRLREQAGILPNTEVEFTYEGDGSLRLFHARKNRNKKSPTRGERFVARLAGSGDIQMTTDEIMKLTRGD